jgi:hypothetical protein
VSLATSTSYSDIKYNRLCNPTDLGSGLYRWDNSLDAISRHNIVFIPRSTASHGRLSPVYVHHHDRANFIQTSGPLSIRNIQPPCRSRRGREIAEFYRVVESGFDPGTRVGSGRSDGEQSDRWVREDTGWGG